VTPHAQAERTPRGTGRAAARWATAGALVLVSLSVGVGIGAAAPLPVRDLNSYVLFATDFLAFKGDDVSGTPQTRGLIAGGDVGVNSGVLGCHVVRLLGGAR